MSRSGIIILVWIIGTVSAIFVFMSILSGSTAPTAVSTENEAVEDSGFFPTNSAPVSRTGVKTTATNSAKTTGTAQTDATAQETIKETASKSVAGYKIIERPVSADSKEKIAYIRYIEKGNGHISEVGFDEKIPAKLSNTTSTGIFDVFWNKDGNTFIMRRLEGINNEIQTIYGSLVSSQASTSAPTGGILKLQGTILPTNVSNLAVSPDKSKIFYLLVNNGSSAGVVSDFKQGAPSDKRTQIFSSELAEWQIAWPTTGYISLTTKPSFNVPGYLFLLKSQESNKMERVLGGINGLTALVSPTTKKVLYSQSLGTGFSSYILDRNTNTTALFPVKTLPEKCVWADDDTIYCAVAKTNIYASYPDDWYQGLFFFDDDLWKIDAKTFAVAQISKLTQTDAVNLSLSESGKYLGYINKQNGIPSIIKISP